MEDIFAMIFKMSEQVLTPIEQIYRNNKEKAADSLEKARLAHEKYLLGQQNTDLQEAIENYIDTVKYDPSIPESYYRLASLMWEQGQISIHSAIEQCKTAISLAPRNMNARLYTGYFLQLSNDYKGAINEFKSAIKMSGINSGRSRMILS